MRIIHDADAIEFVDGDGSKLFLRPAPSKRDIIGSNKMARDEAVEELEKLKAGGIDTDAIMAEAAAKPKLIAAAKEALRTHLPSPKVRRFRFGALAVRIEDGETVIEGHQKLMEAYDDMDFASATWADATVHDLWSAAIPSDADTRGEGADVVVSQEPVSSTD